MRNLAILLPLVFGACSAPMVPHPIPAPDSDLCPAMCTHFRALSCVEGQSVYDNDQPGPPGVPNVTCEQFCQAQQANGVFINPRCGMQVPSCGQIEAWRQKTCK